MAARDAYLADEFQPSFGQPWIPVLPPSHFQDWTSDEVGQYVKTRQLVERNAEENPVGAGWTLPMWSLVLENWKKYQNIVILGGNRCLRGDSPIYDPVSKVTRRIDSIKGKHHVYAWNGRERVIAEAEEPFTKPAGPMMEIRLSNGQAVVGAMEHRVLSFDGSWRQLSELRPGDVLFQPESTLGTFRRDHKPDVQSSTQTPLGSLDDYLPESRLCGEPPHAAAGSVPTASQSLGDAPKHTLLWENIVRSPLLPAFRSTACRSDGRDNRVSRSHAWSRFSLRAIRDGLLRLADRFVGTRCRVSCTPCKSTLQLCVDRRTSQAHQQSTAESRCAQSKHEFDLSDRLSCYGSACVLSAHLVGIEVKWDMTIPAYGNYIASGVVHHNSSKSVLASRICVWAAATIPQAEVRCYHVNEDRSIEDQQRMVQDALPLSVKNLPTKKGVSHSVQYSQKNGFTDNICILPPVAGYRRGGSIKFGNYRQVAQDAQVLEGFKAHVIWGDEEAPQKMFETLQYRTVDYHGRLILTFTTLTGWTPLVQDILGKTRTIKKRFAPLLGVELPIMQESLSRPGTVIYYFWTEDNAFIDTTDFVAKIKGRPRDEILARAYGIPTKAITGVFPSFNKEVNVIPHEKLPWLEANLKKDTKGKTIPYPVTRYMAIDPAGQKNWFMLWVAIDPAGTRWIYREWPDFDDWALPGNTVEGKPGPAQKGSSKGINDYVEMILAMEGGEEIYERLIDPRLGNSEKQSMEGATTIISDLDDADMTVIPAPGVDIEDGLQRINNLLAYDESRPIDSLNGPKLYISDRCQNIIFAMSEYTAKGGRTEASKDPIDCLRYIEVSNPEFYELNKVDTQNRTGCY